MKSHLIRVMYLALVMLLLAACGQQAQPNTDTGAGADNSVATEGTEPEAEADPDPEAEATEPEAEADPDPEPAETEEGAAAGAGTDSEAGLVVYSARKEELMKPLVEAFEEETGIDVTLKTGKPGELQLQIQQEKGSPAGDVFFTTDAAGAEALRQQGLLEPYKSPNAEQVPAEFKAEDGAWTGVIGRSRNLMYNTELLDSADVPDSILDLTDPKYKDKVAMASIEEGGVRLWLAWLLLERGEEFTQKFVSDLKANGIKVLSDHTAVANAVSSGEIPLGVVNHYYYVPQKREGKPVGLVYPDQGADEMGTLVIPLAIGILEGAEHEDTAKRFVDFALSAEGQEPLTTQENEFPLVAGQHLGAAKVEGVKTIDEIKRPEVNFTELAEAEKRAVELFGPDLTAGE